MSPAALDEAYCSGSSATRILRIRFLEHGGKGHDASSIARRVVVRRIKRTLRPPAHYHSETPKRSRCKASIAAGLPARATRAANRALDREEVYSRAVGKWSGTDVKIDGRKNSPYEESDILWGHRGQSSVRAASGSLLLSSFKSLAET